MWRTTARGDYAAAVAGFGSEHKPDALYNQGNALAHAGKLEEAAQAYRQALQQQPSHEDARHNLKIVEDLLKSQQQDNKSEQDHHSQQQDQKTQGQSGQDQSQDQQQDSQQQQQSKDQEGQSGQDQNAANSQQDRQAQSAQSGNPDDAHKSQDKQQQEQAASDPANSAGTEKAGQGNEQQPALSDKEKDVQEQSGAVAGSATQPAKTESTQALEQWLRRIPDDPGGLLRRKFMLQHQQRAQAAGDDGN